MNKKIFMMKSIEFINKVKELKKCKMKFITKLVQGSKIIKFLGNKVCNKYKK